MDGTWAKGARDSDRLSLMPDLETSSMVVKPSSGRPHEVTYVLRNRSCSLGVQSSRDPYRVNADWAVKRHKNDDPGSSQLPKPQWAGKRPKTSDFEVRSGANPALTKLSGSLGGLIQNLEMSPPTWNP